MANNAILYTEIDRTNDSLDRILATACANLERNLEFETDPAKIVYIIKAITDVKKTLVDIKEKSLANKKEVKEGTFKKVMSQLSQAPKLADKINRHRQLKSLMSQAEEFNEKNNDDEQDD